jgi:ABC-type spermidine/putrescine transport system permease subunit I
MTTSLILSFVWLILANVLAMIPSNDDHWRRAYFLIAVGLPLWVWLLIQNGPFVAIVVLAAAASVLRWPVRYLLRWVRRQVGGGQA